MKKIETLVAQFDQKIKLATEDAKSKFSGNVVKLKMLKDKLDYIENNKQGAIESINKIVGFLKSKQMLDVKVKGRSYTHGQVVTDVFAVQLHALEELLKSHVSDLVQA